MENIKFDLQFFAEDPDEGNNTDPTKESAKTFTQEDVDSILSKRLARERKAWEQQLEEERKKAAMTETERLKAESEQKVKEWEEKYKTATERILKAEVKAAATEMGIVDPEVAFLLLKTDEINEDFSNVKDLLVEVIKEKPYLKKSANIGGGTNPPPATNIENPWKRGPHFNLTKQAEILKTNPELAQSMMNEVRKL